MKKLSKAQEKALSFLKENGPSSAYSCRASLTTLNSLVNRGLITAHYQLGAVAFPRSGVIFQIKDSNND